MTGSAGVPPAEGMYEYSLPKQPLNLESCLFSGQVFRWRKTANGYEGIDGPNWYRLSDGRVSSNAGVEEFGELFSLALGDLPPKLILEKAPELERYVDLLKGLRLMQPADASEVFFTFLCTANNNLKRIVPMVEKLADYGPLIPGTQVRSFPMAHRIARIAEADLRSKGFGYRAATITHAAREVEGRGGDAWIFSLRGVGYERAHLELTAIRGIGNKLADCICLYGLHYGEAVPIDTHLWQAATRVFFPEHAGKSLTQARYRQIGDFFRDRFGTLAGWAHLYLYYENLLNWRRRGAGVPLA